MVFEPKFTKVVSSVKKSVGMMQSIVEVKLPTTEGDVSKIVSVGAKSIITSCEYMGKEIVLTGLVDFQAMYVSQDVVAVDYSAEFRDKFVVDNGIVGELICTSNVIDVTSNIVNGAIRVVAIVEICIDQIINQDINVLTDVNGDGVHKSTNELSYSTYLGKAHEKFDVTCEVELDNVKSVLMVTPCISLYSVEPRENYLVLQGSVNLDICSKTGDNVNDLESTYKSTDFTWEVAFDGINTASIIDSVIGLVSNEIKVSTMVDNGVANVNVLVPISYSGYVFADNKIDVIDDLYMERNYLSITCENFETTLNGSWVEFKDNISGSSEILETSPFIDEMLGVCTSGLAVASTRIDNDKLCIEGVANATVAYYTKETNELTSVQVEMPFSVEKKVEGEECSVVTICLDNLTARSKRGKEIEVSGELKVFADTYSHFEKNAITQVVVADEKKEDDCSLYIYVVKPEQTLWEVAKDMNTSQEMILEQNPEINLPLKAGDKLVVYKPVIMQF